MRICHNWLPIDWEQFGPMGTEQEGERKAAVLFPVLLLTGEADLGDNFVTPCWLFLLCLIPPTSGKEALCLLP